MALDDRRRSTKGVIERKVVAGGRRRVTKNDKRFADYSALKASTGIVLPEVRKVLLDRKRIDTERAKHRTHIIYPSEMSKNDWCPRATYYRMMSYPEPESKSSFTLENVFTEGHYIHTKWQSWLGETGKLWGDWRCTRCAEYVKDSTKPSDFYSGSCVGTGWVKLGTSHFTRDMVSSAQEAFPHDWQYKEVTLRSESLPISGHADGALIEHNCLIELKSLGIGSLRFEAPKLLEEHTHIINGKKVVDIDGIWKNFHRPLSSHLKQGNIYLWMCKEMGLPFDRISFIYEFKANQQAKEFIVQYSDDIMAPLLVTASLVDKAVKAGIPPDCPYGGCGSCRSYEKIKDKTNGKNKEN